MIKGLKARTYVDKEKPAFRIRIHMDFGRLELDPDTTKIEKRE